MTSALFNFRITGCRPGRAPRSRSRTCATVRRPGSARPPPHVAGHLDRDRVLQGQARQAAVGHGVRPRSARSGAGSISPPMMTGRRRRGSDGRAKSGRARAAPCCAAPPSRTRKRQRRPRTPACRSGASGATGPWISAACTPCGCSAFCAGTAAAARLAEKLNTPSSIRDRSARTVILSASRRRRRRLSAPPFRAGLRAARSGIRRCARAPRLPHLPAHRAHVSHQLPYLLVGEMPAEGRHAVRPPLHDGGVDVGRSLP